MMESKIRGIKGVKDMSLQLILGGSGSGKTTYLHQAVIQASIKHPEQMYFLIVPEQFTDTKRYCNHASESWNDEY